MNCQSQHNCVQPRLIITFALLVAGMLTTPSRAQYSVDDLLKNSVQKPGPEHREVADAIEAFRTGNFLRTRELLESARTKDPKLPPASVLLAQLLYAANQPSLARAELERVTRDEPSDPEAYLLFGEAAFQERRFTDAELSFKKAAELTADYAANPFRKNTMIKRAYSGLAAVAEAREDWATAANFLDPILKADPTDAYHATRMANAVFKQAQGIGDPNQQRDKEGEAYTLLKQLWEKNDNVQRPEITMGRLYEDAGNRSMAERMMKLATERDQNGLATQLSVARWAMEAGELELAQQCAERAVTISADSVDAKLVSGLVARYRKDYAKARAALESAHLQSPSNLAAMLQLAVVLIEQGEERAASDYAEISRRVYADLSKASGREAAVTFAWVLFRQGRGPEAQRILQQALTGGSVSAESSYFAARILHSQGNSKDAKSLLEAALRNERVFPGRGDAEKLLVTLGGESTTP